MAERRTVDANVVGSKPIRHPKKIARIYSGQFFILFEQCLKMFCRALAQKEPELK